MISVSRAAGYGKFTQTNDSHLPEARDTIERGEVVVVGGGEEEVDRRGGDHRRRGRSTQWFPRVARWNDRRFRSVTFLASRPSGTSQGSGQALPKIGGDTSR